MKILHVLARLLPVASLLALTTPVRADNARFDLVGPRVDVRVTRGSTTLPIAEVPNLLAGDKLWVRANLPDDQRNHLLLIVAFLRGTTNEPPDNWFTEIDTWDKKHTAEGTTVTVPDGAQQALLFIAPETGGDFKTLRSAVKGRPGTFIRADADLNQASFEQQRIERYLAAMKQVQGEDPKAIQDHSAKLASTLALKPNADCFKQPVEAQVTCLTQSSAPLLMDDGHGQSIAAALSTGASSDFINAASYTGAAGAGLYSAYVGAVVDLVHLVSTLHTAKYQYIPGLSFPEGDTLNLKLNAPVSFIDPKSVIVIGLPAIQKAITPPLHAHDANEVACLLQPHMALEVEGAPLVFSTSFAHDLVLHLNRNSGATDLPLAPDAFDGGLTVSDQPSRKPLEGGANLGGANPPASRVAGKTAAPGDLLVTGTVHGFWGFDPFEGPTLTLQQVDGKGFKVVGNTQLLAGQDNHLTLQGEGTACIDHIALTDSKAKKLDVSFKPQPTDDNKPENKPGTTETLARALALDVPLKAVQPGGYSLAIRQYGDKDTSDVALTAYTGDIHLDALKIHEGDNIATLTGQGLSNVADLQLSNQSFLPRGEPDGNTLVLESRVGVTPNDGAEATVRLKDGRSMPVKVATEAARPGLDLLSFSATPAAQAGAMPVRLAGKDEIPLDGKLSFVVQTKAEFPRDQKIEVATADGSLKTVLSLKDNTLVLQDAHTAIAQLAPLKAFGRSAFGKLQMRPVAADGTTGNWTPLGTLVRTPEITSIHCTSVAAPTCDLEGNDLFLVQAFSPARDFTQPANVPSGYSGTSMPVPTPADGSTLYLKLRDDPSEVAAVTLSQPLAAPGAPAAPTQAPAPQTPPVSGAATPGQPSPAVPGNGGAKASASPSPTTAAATQQPHPAEQRATER